MPTKQGISTAKGFQKKVPQAESVNGLEIKRDENGVLKIGDIVIPQKILLKEDITITAQSKCIYENSEGVAGTYEVVIYGVCYKFTLTDEQSGMSFLHNVSQSDSSSFNADTTYICRFGFGFSKSAPNKLNAYVIYTINGTVSENCEQNGIKLYKIIE